MLALLSHDQGLLCRQEPHVAFRQQVAIRTGASQIRRLTEQLAIHLFIRPLQPVRFPFEKSNNRSFGRQLLWNHEHPLVQRPARANGPGVLPDRYR